MTVEMTKCKFPDKVCEHMTIYNGTAYCGSSQCNLKAEESLKVECSLKDTKELKKLIVENPNLPLLVFAGEEAWNGGYGYSQADVHSASVERLTLYDEMWMSEDEYRERLGENLEYVYEDMTDIEYDMMIDKIVKETAFIKAIVMYVG